MTVDDKPQSGTGVTASTPDGRPIVVNIVQPNLAAEGAAQMAAGRALNMDEGPVGGKYLKVAADGTETYLTADGLPYVEPKKD